MSQYKSVLREDVALTDTLSTTAEITYSDKAGGMIFIPAASPITAITWYAAVKRGATFFAAYTESGVAITQTVSAEQAVEIPKALAGAAAIKAVVNADGEVDLNTKY